MLSRHKLDGYVDVKYIANMLGVIERRVQAMCSNGIILGAFKARREWLIKTPVKFSHRSRKYSKITIDGPDESIKRTDKTEEDS